MGDHGIPRGELESTDIVLGLVRVDSGYWVRVLKDRTGNLDTDKHGFLCGPPYLIREGDMWPWVR